MCPGDRDVCALFQTVPQQHLSSHSVAALCSAVIDWGHGQHCSARRPRQVVAIAPRSRPSRRTLSDEERHHGGCRC